MTSIRPDWAAFPGDLLAFWTERHLCTLSSVRPDGRPHLVPVGVTIDVERECAWVITSGTSYKARLLAAEGSNPHVAACQVDGGRWSTIEGRATVLDDPESVRRAVEKYAERYRTPRENPARVALRIEVDRILHSSRI
ncbi:pyridoxamine 5'-phosphate oxidase family protein [Nocardioides sp.]|uniref:pyridoxamine 5'-phosphate oxidase family protein n=1 Tax=Nocardioides sp. TaxID=35761 RepID=UPI003D0BA499